jgi:ABC-type transport system substrate-binding protein
MDPSDSDLMANANTTNIWPQASLYAQVVKRGYPNSANPTTITGELADKWDVSPDYGTYTFYLNKSAKWHDATPITARDVEYMIVMSSI